MRIKVQVVMAINNTSVTDRMVRSDEFILDDNFLVFPEIHKKPIESLVEAGYKIESVSVMNETQSRVVSFNAIPTSVMFESFTAEQIYRIVEEYLKIFKEVL